jgi:rare lipoprotein A
MKPVIESRVVYLASEHQNPVAGQRFCARLVKLSVVALAGLVLANCAQQQVARRGSSGSKEIGAFPQAKYGTASQRVVGEGQDVPKGGGRDMVGKPYTIAGKRYTPYAKPTGFTQVGLASWYGEAFHGRKTANGEIYDRHGVSAAHTTMPLPSYARVTNVLNGRSIIVRVNDRGPYHGNRVIDLSQATADALAYRHLGVARVKIDYIGRASTGGSDDKKLLATLRTDGQPASLPGFTESPTQVARATPATPIPQQVSAPVAASVPDDGADDGQTVGQGFQPVTPRAASVLQPPARTQPLAAQASFSPQVLPAATTQIQRAGSVPLPPERPFDLATIPNAGVPVAVSVPGLQRPSAAPLPPQRPQVAGLMFVPTSDAPQMFSQKHPLMKDIKPQRFVRLDSAN